ncbi:MAG: glycine--tRNA ligase subunit beta [Acidobacteriota bacterium]
MPLSFQDLILALQQYWTRRGCILSQPCGVEVGAGTMNPDTFFRVLGPEPWRVAYVEPSRRPSDARYGDNPFRLYKHYQFQVILKPSPSDVQDLYLQSLRVLGIDPRRHDVRFEEDNWESPTLGAQGVGWQVLLDGMEISQFTYFQRVGGLELEPVSAEITYGMERICMYLHDTDSIFDLPWNQHLSYREVRHREEWEFSKYAFESAEIEALSEGFQRSEAEAHRLIKEGLMLPAYDACLRCSHLFNLLEARGAVSVTERTGYILRVRNLACRCARSYLQQREELGFPLGTPVRRTSRPVPRARLRSRPRNDFLLEVGCEEIPAAAVDAARTALGESLNASLREHRITSRSWRTFSTPRRLAVLISGLPARQDDREEEVMGPPARVAYDGEGRPTQAAIGFARGHKIKPADLRKISTPKGEYVGFTRQVSGLSTPELLQQLVEQVLKGLSFSKSMHWEQTGWSFTRPIRWVLALWNDQVLPLELAGVRSGRETFGHRVKGRPKVRLRKASDYARVLRGAGVWVDHESRSKRIKSDLSRAAVSARGRLLPDPRTFAEVNHLVEWPKIISGRFDPEFLVLPREVLLATLRHHQKFFALTDRKGKLLPCFLAVIDQRSDPKGIIRRGNERVLKARLTDARFFWTEDRRIRFENRAPRLRAILFHEKLGTLEQRVARLASLASDVAPHFPTVEAETLKRALELSKLDLTTDMVKEFPTLQGVMGGVYAREQGEREEISRAIYDQYRPHSLEDTAPGTPLGCALSVVDRLDTVGALFSVGEIPTGSRDPFGLRRSSQGLIKILLESKIHLPLDSMLTRTLEIVREQGVPPPSRENVQALQDFVRGRVRYLLEQAGHRYDMINAALAAGQLDPFDVQMRASALEAVHDDETFGSLSIAFKRIRKILTQGSGDGAIDSQLFKEKAERSLHEQMNQIRGELEILLQRRNYPDALRAVASLRPAIDTFFNDVLVMDRDPSLRRNRMSLLRSLSDMFLKLADFSEIVVEGESRA